LDGQTDTVRVKFPSVVLTPEKVIKVHAYRIHRLKMEAAQSS